MIPRQILTFFCNAFLSALIIPWEGHGMIFAASALSSMDLTDILTISLFSSLGMVLAFVINYLFGYGMEWTINRHAKNKKSHLAIIALLNKAPEVLKVLILMICANAWFAGNLFVIAYGYVRYNPIKFVLITIIARTLYLFYYLNFN